MPRPTTNMPINTISGRRGLPPKTAPYWRGVYQGLRVGWLRRAGDTGGRWYARLALPGNDIRQTRLGAADDPPTKADGSDVLNYSQAVVAAQDWAAAIKANPDASTQPRGQRRRRTAGAGGPTVEDAMTAYIDAKRLRGQADRAGEAQTVLDRYMALSFRALAVQDLTPDFLNAWLGQLGGADLSQGRIDKLRGVLRAALYQAKAREAVIRDGLSAAAMPRREAPATRDVIPSPGEVQRLIAEMRAIDKDLALFLEVLAVTGTRPSQLSRCRRDALDTLNGLLTVPASNKGRAGVRKTGRSSTFPIGTELAGRIAGQLDGPSNLLFHTGKMVQDFSLVDRERFVRGAAGSVWREVGRIAWDKDQWTRKVRRAVQAAGLDPKITLYGLRHARIIRLIQGGMALREVAALCDTSAAMIERTYSRHIAASDATTAKLSRLLEAERAAAPRLQVVA